MKCNIKEVLKLRFDYKEFIIIISEIKLDYIKNIIINKN